MTQAATRAALNQWEGLVSPEPFAALLTIAASGGARLVVNERVTQTAGQHHHVGAWARDLIASGARYGLLDEGAVAGL